MCHDLIQREGVCMCTHVVYTRTLTCAQTLTVEVLIYTKILAMAFSMQCDYR